ncbi:hypothetical protein CHUAL_006491 [Chamberlinius hualienensis]
MAIAIHFIFVIITASTMAQPQTPICHDDVYTTLEDTTSGISYCDFLTDQFNPDGVADSCSGLKNSDRCPTNYDGKNYSPIAADNYMYNISNTDIELDDGNQKNSPFSVVTNITNLNMAGYVECNFQAILPLKQENL